MSAPTFALALTASFASVLPLKIPNDVPRNFNNEDHEKYSVSISFNDSISTLEFLNIGKWKKYEGSNTYFEFYSKELKLLKCYVNSEDDNEDKICSLFEGLVNEIYFDDMFNWIFNLLNDQEKFDVLSALLNSDINIFVEWYKKALMVCMKSKDCTIAKKSENIFNLYKEDFEEVTCM